MRLLSSLFPVRRNYRRWLAPVLLALAVVGCKDEVEKVEPLDTSYYPLQVGDFRIYEVTDTTWLRNVKTITRYQFRERVEEQYSDASGRTAFRVLRTRRNTPADAWRIDSVLVVSPATTNVQVTRNNRRTVELIYPVRTGYFWNQNAFNATDSIPFHYKKVGEAFTTTTAGGATATYPKTVMTAVAETAAEGGGLYINPFYYYRLRQVYASGIGPVYRSRRRFIYTENGGQNPSPDFIFSGSARTEILLESGR
jgi:hypothetical protein